MIPFRDDNPRSSFPILIIGLIAANTLVWLYEFSLQMTSDRAFEAFIDVWALHPNLLFVDPIRAAPTLISSMFMHGSWLHIVGNMIYLWVFGDNIEDTLGKALFLPFYLACGFAASAAQILIDPTSTIPNLGASGAIAGVLGAYFVLFPRARVQGLTFFGGWGRIMTLPSIVVLGFWFVLQLLPGFLSIGGEGGGVAYFAHIGGFVAGALAMLVYGPMTGRPTILTGAAREQIGPGDDYRQY
jgi:rhomboid family protein